MLPLTPLWVFRPLKGQMLQRINHSGILPFQLEPPEPLQQQPGVLLVLSEEERIQIEVIVAVKHHLKDYLFI